MALGGHPHGGSPAVEDVVTQRTVENIQLDGVTAGQVERVAVEVADTDLVVEQRSEQRAGPGFRRSSSRCLAVGALVVLRRLRIGRQADVQRYACT